MPSYCKAVEKARKTVDERFTIGVLVSEKDSEITDVVQGLPAAKSGVAPGMKLVAVNGRAWTRDILREAVSFPVK